MATCTVSGGRYVGATRKGIEGRRERHFIDAKRRKRDCPRFYDAIRKYGNDAFEWTTLATLPTSEEMYKEEERLIALLKPEYNIASGGLVFTSKERHAQFVMTFKQRLSKPVICLNDGATYPSIRAAALVHGVSKPSITHLCESGGMSRSGLFFSYITEPMTQDERLDTISKRREQKSVTEQARKDKVAFTISRPVTDLTTGVIYASATVADRSLALVPGTAEACARRERASRRGECFAFGQLSEPERLISLEKFLEKRQVVDDGWKKKIGVRNSRVVICAETRKLYDNSTVAAKSHGLTPYMVYTSCRSGKPTTSGIAFSYLD